VRDTLTYKLTEAGTYRVSAFNDMGEFSDDYGTQVEFAPEDVDTSISYNAGYYSVVVLKTCMNVGPGESCTARCPGLFEQDFGNYTSTDYTTHASGGACSTSDIVEADAFAGPNSYKCTVPTFSGEVVAQAICPFR
jgi:hypothetical protein